MANDIRINILINRSGDPFDEIRRELRGVRDAIKETTAATEEAGAKGSTRWTELRSQLSLIKGGLEEVQQFARAAWQMLGEGAELELAASRFDKLAESIGTTADALLIDLRKATMGTASDADLISGAVRMLSMDFASTHEEAVRLTRVVGSLDMSMSLLRRTLGGQTTAFFDEMGMSVEGFDERLKALQGTMSDKDAFTMAFIEQAEAHIDRWGRRAETAAGDIMRLEAAWKNMTDEFKKEFVDQVDLEQLVDDVQELTASVTDAIGPLMGFGKALKFIAEFIAEWNPPAAIGRGIRGAFDWLSGNWAHWNVMLDERNRRRVLQDAHWQAIEREAAAEQRAEQATRRRAQAAREAATATQQETEAVEEAIDGLERLAGILQEREHAMRQVRGGGLDGGLVGDLGMFSSQELRAWGQRVREAGRDAAADVDEAADEIDEAVERLNEARANIVRGAIEQQGDLVARWNEAQRQILEDPENFRARQQFEDANQAIADSYAQMVFDVITASDGWDRVAADWAVASGMMTQAEADMRFAVQSAGQVIGELGVLVDEGQITPEQAAQLMAPIVEAVQTGNSDIGAILSDARRQIEFFVRGDWFSQLQAEEGFIDPVERKTMLMLAGTETRLGGIDESVRGLTGAAGEGVTVAQKLHTEMEAAVGPWEMDLEHGAIGTAISDAQSLYDEMWALTQRNWSINVAVNQSGGVSVPLDVERGSGRGRARGGSVLAGMTYRVGEFGAEEFTPWTNGTITPHHEIGGSGPVYIVQVDARGAASPAEVEQSANRGVRAALRSQGVPV